jgi:hypothetical protein
MERGLGSLQGRRNRPSATYKALIALFLFGLLLYAGAASAQSPIATDWQGTYSYPKGDQRLPVSFTLKLFVNGKSISGRTTEPATFGNGSSSYLFANITGTLSGSNVDFTKTYDGTAGVSHSVEYRGLLSVDGTTMSGSWNIKDFSGTFSATASGK